MNTYNVYSIHATDTVIVGVIEAGGYHISKDGRLSFFKGNETIATYNDWSGVQKVEPKTEPERREDRYVDTPIWDTERAP